jgi:hypothetical protein
MVSAARKRDPRPYTLRVRRDHGGGLWTFEGDDGQLYLAVKKKGFQPTASDPPWPTDAERLQRVNREIDTLSNAESSA